MADFATRPEAAGAFGHGGKWVNVAGAAVSLALIVGIGVWGYKLIKRDANGVPIVRALEGEMRIQPENPGGEIAVHTGLSVNTVIAEGGAAAPEDRLILAPSQPDLPQEDLDVVPLAERGEVAPAADDAGAGVEVALQVDPEADAAADPDAPLTPEDILAIADQIAAGVEPFEAAAEDSTDAVATEAPAAPATPAVTVIPADVPGVARSLRPQTRPAGIRPQPVATPAAAEAPVAPEPVELTGALPAGTTLVQLGAHGSTEVAATEWQRLQARFPDFMADKDRVVQEAQSGGRTFYRLRALGFADHADASRFCAALVAEGERCIPVVVR